MIDIWLTCCHLDDGAYYWQQLGLIGTDKCVVTLLAECTNILLPGSRQPSINFHVCVLHLKIIHTISSLQNLLGIQSFLATLLATMSVQFVSWWLQEQELWRQQQSQRQRLVRVRIGVSQQQENVNGVKANQRSDELKYGNWTWWGMQRACMSVRGATKWNTAVGLDGACRGARMSVRGATKWNTADQSDGACRGARTSVRGATCREWRASSQFIIVESFLF